MPPFDLRSANLFDVMHADLSQPAEVREAYLSMPPEADDHEHGDVVRERRNTAITPHSGTLRLSDGYQRVLPSPAS